MERWRPEKKDVLDAVAAEILHNYGRGRALVGVDGPDGAGKTHFADALAIAIRNAGHHVVRAELDGFLRPRSERNARGSDSPDGCYLDCYDYSTFRRVLVEPFRLGGGASFVTAAFDAGRDTPVPTRWKTAPADSLLVVDGVFLNRPELAGLWNYSIWLDVPQEIAFDRMAERDGTTDAASRQHHLRRYGGAQELYTSEARPRAAASAIIDNSDFEHPRRVFADAC